MADNTPTIGYFRGHAAEKFSRLGLWHRQLLQFRIYRWFFTLIFNQRTIIAIPYGWLILFFLVPFLLVIKISLSESTLSQPPYTHLFNWLETGVLELKLNFYNYLVLWEDSLYIQAYLNSLKIAAIATFFTLLIGYPIAYAIRQAPGKWRFYLLMLVILPFWTSFLIRVYAWIGILKPEGFLNNFLMALGLIDHPLQILNTPLAVYIGIVYSYLPFMILPLYANLEKMDHTLIEAAQDLGCRPLKAFWVIAFPLSLPGILAGCFLVFIPAIGEFVIPDLLGGSDILMIGKVLWDEFFINNDWPLSSAIAVILLLILIGPIILFQRLQRNKLDKK